MGTQNRVIGYLIWNYPTRCPLSKEHIVLSGSEERSQTLHLFGQFSYPHSFIFSNNWDRYFGNVLRGRRQSAQEVPQLSAVLPYIRIAVGDKVSLWEMLEGCLDS